MIVGDGINTCLHCGRTLQSRMVAGVVKPVCPVHGSAGVKQ